MRIAICDDGKKNREHLQKIAREWAEERKQALRLTQYESGENFLFAWDEGNGEKFDGVFLDIRMGGMSGMQVAEQIRRSDASMMIVFATGFLDYAVQGYEMEALRYLIKPARQRDVFACLDRMRTRFGEEAPVYTFFSQRRQVRIALGDILYCESFGHYVELHSDGGMFRFKKDLSEVERELGEGFTRTHRSVLVNVHRIRLIGTELELDNGQLLPLADSRRSELRKRLSS